jgi:predicted small lipoprotein YifL
MKKWFTAGLSAFMLVSLVACGGDGSLQQDLQS